MRFLSIFMYVLCIVGVRAWFALLTTLRSKSFLAFNLGNGKNNSSTTGIERRQELTFVTFPAVRKLNLSLQPETASSCLKQSQFHEIYYQMMVNLRDVAKYLYYIRVGLVLAILFRSAASI